VQAAEERKTVACETSFELEVLSKVNPLEEWPEVLRSREQASGRAKDPALSMLAWFVRESAVGIHTLPLQQESKF